MPMELRIDAARRAELTLALVPDVGPLLRQRLLESFGDAAQVLAASRDQLQQVPGIGAKISTNIVQADQLVDLDAQLALVHQHGLRIWFPADAQYPPLLRQIHDPPGVLFGRGDLEPADELAVAIVGTRRPSRYGLQQAEQLAHHLARAGVTVVSGLARGIDAAAHRGALAAGGRTIAVLGCGVLRNYPAEHAELARSVAAQGCVISEVPPTMGPARGLFPQRNRIISGLSLGTVVVEAGDRSGALITARLAMEQNREVFAVPGQIDQPQSAGPHQLLRDGAKLVTSADDVLEELGPLAWGAAPTRHGAGGETRWDHLPLDDSQRRVLAAIEPAGVFVDELVVECQLPVQVILAAVGVLESRFLIRKLGGNRVVLREGVGPSE
jgi:DNA processing protein